MKKSYLLAANAMIAATYAVLTVVLSPISYGEIQARIPEIMLFLGFYNKKLSPGLIAGCLIANMFSPMGLYDIIFGTAATAIVVISMNYLKERWQVALSGGIVNGVIVGWELHLAFDLPFVINAIYVFIGEFAVLLLGAFIFKQLEKNKAFMETLNEIK